MLILEEILLVSADRVACCRGQLELDLDQMIQQLERSGFSRKEILVAMSETISEEFSALPDMPKFH